MHKRYLSLLVITAMLLPAFLAMATPVSAVDAYSSRNVAWMKSTLDKTSQVGTSMSAVFDAEGNIYASYYAEASDKKCLKYLSDASGLLVTTTVDDTSGTGMYNSIVISKLGQPWIAYYNENDRTLRYARLNENGIWDKGTIDSSQGVGRYNSIAVAPNGDLGVAYYDANEQLKFAVWSGSSWTVETVGAMKPGTTSVGYFSDGTPVIVYMNENSKLTYAMKTNGTWTKTVIDEQPATISSAAVDAHDALQVAYVRAVDDALIYGILSNGVWAKEEVDPGMRVDYALSLKVDFRSKPHITYYDTLDDQLMYASNTTGAWTFKVLDDQYEAGRGNVVAVNGYAKVIVLYVQTLSSDVKYLAMTTNINAAWDVHSVSGTLVGVGKENAIAIDGNGVTHIAYCNETSRKLYYANDKTGEFVSAVVDDATGSNPSMAVTSDGKVYIAYYDQAGKHLKYATDSTGTWVITTLDSSSGVGERNAIAIYGSNIGILYTADIGSGNVSLKFASMPSLEITTVDSSGKVDIASEMSMVSDSAGVLYASYYRSQNLYYLTRSGSAWAAPALVDDSALFGSDTTITKAADGRVFIAYHAFGSNNGIWLATLVQGTWSKQPVISKTLGAGAQNSVTVDITGQPQVVYGGTSDFELLYSAWDSGVWGYTTLYGNDIAGDISSAIDPVGRVHVLYFDAELNRLMLTDLLVPPSLPQSFSATAGEKYVSLSWNTPAWDGGSGVNGYIVYRGYSSTTMTPLAKVDAGVLTYNDTDLTPGVKVYYSVRSFNVEGASAFTDTVVAEPTGSTPAKGLDMMTIVIIIVAIVAIVAVVVVFLLRRR